MKVSSGLIEPVVFFPFYSSEDSQLQIDYTSHFILPLIPLSYEMKNFVHVSIPILLLFFNI